MISNKRFIAALLISVCIATAFVLVRRSLSSRTDKDRSQVSQQSEQQNFPLDDSSPEVAVTLPLFHRLDENFIRGSQPERGGVGVLARLGVKAIVDLRSVYDHTDEIGVAAGRAGISYYWLPMSVWNPPTDEEAQKFVSLVTDESKGPFFIFCADGLHRTGEMSAIYRIVEHKWSVEDALKELDELGFNPYYYNLRNYVWTYARRFRPAAVPVKARRLSPMEQWEAEQASRNKRR